MKKVIIGLLLLFSCGVAQSQTISATGTLATVAATLTPGQWGEVTGMTNFTNVGGSGLSILDEIPAASFYGGAGTDTLLSFMDKMKWNPLTHELYIFGGAHNSSCPCEKWAVKFNADTNAWSYLPMPPDATKVSDWGGVGYLQTGAGQHYYDYSALDTVNQIFYIHDSAVSGGGEFRSMAFDIKTSTWTTLPHNFAQNAYGEGTLESQEYFPDLRKLVYTNSQAYIIGNVSKGAVTQWDPRANQWGYLNGSLFANPPAAGTQGFQVPMGVTYPISRYDNQQHVLYFGGGAPDGGVTTATNQLYQYQIYNGTTCAPTPDSGTSIYDTGCTTALPTAGAPGLICMRCGIQEIDPVTGDLIIFAVGTGTGPSSLVKYVYHNGASSWTSSNVGPVSGTNILYTGDSGYPMYGEVSASIPDDGTYEGVILVLQYLSVNSGRLLVYKNAQKPSLSAKCALSGVLNCWTFNSPTNIDSHGKALTYNWDEPNSYLDVDPILMGQFNYPLTGWRNTGEALSKAYNSGFTTPTPSVVSIAQIDTSTKFEGGGSLLIPMGQYNKEETAKFYDNFDGVLGHPNVAICNNITNCPQGNTIWTQAMVRVNDSMVNDFVLECSLQLANSCENDGVLRDHGTATTTVDCTACTSGGYGQSFCTAAGNPGSCPGSHVGKRLYNFGGSNCQNGIFTITAVNSPTQIVLDRSPSNPGTQCSGGTIWVENLGQAAQGWKLILLVSNALPIGAAPNGSPNGNCECEGEVMDRANQGYPVSPQIYDSKGNNSPGLNQLNYRFIGNTWQEVTEEVIVGNYDGGINRTHAEVKWWVDGNLADDWTGALLEINGGDSGYGLGQLQLLTYTTKRDSFFAGSSPAGSLAWYDNVITSTQPIPFNKDAGGSTVACSSPSKVVYTSPPSSALVNATLGTVVAQIEDSSGVLCTTATNSVTLSKHSGATWGTLQTSSSLTKNASGGVVGWNDLSISSAGSGSIDAASSGLTTAVSNSIDITNSTACSGASKVVITTQPGDAQLGANIGTITAEIRDSTDHLCNTATNNVALSKHSGATWGTLVSASNPTLAKNATAGVVSWSDLSIITTTGSGAIDIASSGLTGATTNSINITVVIPGGGSVLRRRP